VLLPRPADGAEHARTIRLKPGTTSTVLRGSVVRGDRDSFAFHARAGQRLTLRLTAIEHNAAFTVFNTQGTPLPGTAEGRDATRWSGRLPANGRYRIVVGGTRGNATYTLRFAVL
jgi:hypothetical protein